MGTTHVNNTYLSVISSWNEKDKKCKSPVGMGKISGGHEGMIQMWEADMIIIIHLGATGSHL